MACTVKTALCCHSLTVAKKPASNQFRHNQLYTLVALLLMQTATLNTAVAVESADPSTAKSIKTTHKAAPQKSPADTTDTNLKSDTTPLAMQPATTLQSLTVSAATSPTETSQTHVNQQQIKQELIASQADLVRYNPEISVAEVGRYGSKGFSVRGVDGNRVAMSFDGVALPEQQINQVFSPYGYMFEGRYSPDVELLSSVTLQAGSDAFNAGSGALGGAINYQSKQPNNLIKSGEKLGGYLKTGYSDKNQESMTAFGLAGKNDTFEALVNYVYREGHALKNHRMVKHQSAKLDPNYAFPDNEIDQKGILPDPSHYESHASLAKLYWRPSEAHRLGIHGSYQYRENHNQAITKRTYSSQRRIGYDEAELSHYGLSYQYLPSDSRFLAKLDADATYQKVTGVANTYIYVPESYSSDQNVLDRNEYRPQYDTTKQFSLSAESLPLDTKKWGSHTFNLSASYGKLDHELIMKSWAKLSGKDLNSFEFIGPSVKKDVYSVALADNIQVNDQINAKLGVRYDDHNYKPYMSAIDRYSLSETSDTYYAKRLYLDGEFDKHTHMHQLGWLAGIDYQLSPSWQTGYKLSTGFLAPSFSQMYSAFEIMGNRLTTNVNLKPEKSLNHELSLQGNFSQGSVNATAFYTDYQDFINTVYLEKLEPACYTDSTGDSICTPMLRNYIAADNIDRAKTYGMRLGGVWDVSKWSQLQGKLQLTGDISIAKDRTNEGINLLATQPLTGIFGMDYQAQDKSFDVHGKLRYLGAKNPNDAKVKKYIFQGRNQKSKEVIEPYEHISASKSAVVYDIYGTKHLKNGIKLSAGVYNVFNKQYTPWSNLRSLAETSVNAMVDDAGQGLARYTAPGRNYALALSYEF